MKEVSLKRYSKYFLIILFFILIILAFLLIKDLIVSILGGILLAYFCFPLYKQINKIIKNKNICSFLVILLLLLVITIPLFFIVKVLITESMQFYNYILSLNIISDPTVNDIIQKGFLFIKQIASNFVLALPTKLIGLFVMFLIMFYLLRDGENLVKQFKKIIPIDEKKKNLLFEDFKLKMSAVGYGVILTAILEGVISSLGFYLFGVKSFILLGFVVFIFAILPAIGASIIWIPAVIIKFYNGESWNAFGLIITGLIISVYLEMILKPKLIGERARVHPVLIVLGVFGGLKFLGIVGIVFGPLILTTLLTLFNFVYKNEIKN